MISEEKQMILQAVEHYIQTGKTDDGQVKVTRLADNKTSCIEQVAGDSRTVTLREYTVEGRVVWAAYSVRTGMVYLSQVR